MRVRGREMARWIQGWSFGLGHKFRYGRTATAGYIVNTIYCDVCSIAILFDPATHGMILGDAKFFRGTMSPTGLRKRFRKQMDKRTCHQIQMQMILDRIHEQRFGTSMENMMGGDYPMMGGDYPMMELVYPASQPVGILPADRRSTSRSIMK